MSRSTVALGRMHRIRAANRGEEAKPVETIRAVVSRLSKTSDGSALLAWLEDMYLIRPAPMGSDASTLSEREGQRRLVHQILSMVEQPKDEPGRSD